MAVISSNALTGITTRIADASMSAGSIIQVKQAFKTDTFSTTSHDKIDVTGLSVAITPSSSSSKFLITGCVRFGQEYDITHGIHLIINGSEVGLADAAGSRTRTHGGCGYLGHGDSYSINDGALDYLVNASDANEHTIKVQVSNGDTTTRTFYIGRSNNDTDSAYLTRAASSLTVMEVAV